jgi:competence protein ComGC
MAAPQPSKSRHFSLLEVAIVLIVLAALSLFAIPQVQSRQMLAHEEGARAMLRQIHDAERQFFLANDGRTYGFLVELLGAELRPDVRVKPKMLAATGLRSLGPSHLKDGYLFMVVLPGRGVPGVSHDNYANADYAKVHRGYLAYAWPVMAGYSGRLVYVIDETGELRQYRNDREPPVSGLGSPPAPDLGARRGDAFGGPSPAARDVRFEPAPR